MRPEIADMVRYDTLNLLAPSWPINEVRRHLLSQRDDLFRQTDPGQDPGAVRSLLKPGGLLFAGHSENFTYISQDFRLRGQTVYECGGRA